MNLWKWYVLYATVGSLIDMLLYYAFVYQEALSLHEGSAERKLVSIKFIRFMTILIAWPFIILAAIRQFFKLGKSND